DRCRRRPPRRARCPGGGVMTSAAQRLREFLRATLPPDWVAAVESNNADALDESLADPARTAQVVRTVAAQGWLAPEWPREYGGLALAPDEAVGVRRGLARWRVGTVGSAIGIGWVGPSILRYASPEVAAELLPPIARNEALWCQLFSEPEAGSDLAAVRTRAVRDGDRWIVNGAKIWTSRADRAAWGLAVVRTDPEVPKHAGLTCLCVNMTSPGVEIRPIRQMTGDAEFFEVR